MSIPIESKSILLVEDSADEAELALRAFAAHDLTAQVHWVTDGAQALDYIFCAGEYCERDFSQAPVVVLLDFQLPKVDGMEVLRRVKGDARTKMLPIVMMSSSNQEQTAIDSYESGANSYLVKPVDSAKFSEMLRCVSMYWAHFNRPPPFVARAPG